jgi:Peptidase A4 family
MLRRWCIPLVTTALLAGTWLAAGSASAAPLAAHPAAPPATQGFSPGGPMVRPVTAGRSSAAPGALNAEVQSLNWSGYAATGANGAFTSVSASWTQPTATCPSSAAQYSSFWAGLDGFSSDSVEQTGTDSDCNGTTPVYYGWYEMFPAAPVVYSNRVEPGDHMSASVTFSGTRTYTLVLTDSTRGWTRTVTKNEAGLDRSSAEVITEAPSSTTGVLPLADFGTVSYASAQANGTSLASQSPTEIVIADASGNPEDSTSAISSAGAFSNTWLSSS